MSHREIRFADKDTIVEYRPHRNKKRIHVKEVIRGERGLYAPEKRTQKERSKTKRTVYQLEHMIRKIPPQWLIKSKRIMKKIAELQMIDEHNQWMAEQITALVNPTSLMLTGARGHSRYYYSKSGNKHYYS